MYRYSYTPFPAHTYRCSYTPFHVRIYKLAYGPDLRVQTIPVHLAGACSRVWT